MREIPFLSYLVQKLEGQTQKNSGNLTWVLPSRRVIRALSDLLQKSSRKEAVWMPRMLTIDEFAYTYSGLEKADPLELSFLLYDAYVSVMEKAGEKTRTYTEFSEWGEMLLGDFHQLDSQLASIKEILSYVAEEKRISGSDLELNEQSLVQSAYLSFYKQLYPIYLAFSQSLFDRHIAYMGQAERQAYKKINRAYQENTLGEEFYVFAGFNALTQAEEEIMRLLIKAGKAEVFWDVDAYYVNEDPTQEAGWFMRRYQKDPLLGKHIREEEMTQKLGKGAKGKELKKEATILGCSQMVGQAEMAGMYLQKWYETEGFKGKTAVVLNDESLLLPLLNALPPGLEYNLSVAVPLLGTRVHQWIELILDGKQQVEESGKRGEKQLHISILSAIWRHSLWQEWMSVKGSKVELFLAGLFAENKSLFNRCEWESLPIRMELEGHRLAGLLTEFLFEKEGQKNIGLACFQLFLEIMKWVRENVQTYLYEKEFAGQAVKYAQKELAVMTQYSHIQVDLSKWIRSYKAAMSHFAVNYRGNPQACVQITGMLETRMLDFDRVIMLSVNEGVLPSSNKDHSFLLDSVKRYCRIPTEQEKTSMQAYYFYRLLHFSEKTVWLYVRQDKIEKSRFLWQMAYEKPLFIQTGGVYPFPLRKDGVPGEIGVEKDPSVLQKIYEILSEGISATMMNTYLSCGMKFYYHYILRIKDKIEFDDRLGSDKRGTVVHYVLERFFSTRKNIELKQEDIAIFRKNTSELLEEAIQEKFAAITFDTGKNAIERYKMEKWLVYFSNSFEEEIKTRPGLNRVIDCELNLKKSFVHPHLQEGLDVKLVGKIDRIDFFKEKIRIIDYKTGRVEERDLKIETAEDLYDTSREKALQLIFYSYLYWLETKKHKGSFPLAGIYSLVALGHSPFMLSGAWSEQEDDQKIKEIESLLVRIIQDWCDPTVCFKQNKNACLYCAYKDLCGI